MNDHRPNTLDAQRGAPPDDESALAAARREAVVARERLEAVLAGISAQFLVLDRDGHCIHVNDRVVEVTGRTKPDLLGRSVWELFPDTAGTTFESELRRALAERRPAHFEYHCRPPSPPRPPMDPAPEGRQSIARGANPWGEGERWFESHVCPTSEGLTLLLTDITDRKRAEAERSASEQRFAGFMHHLPGLAWIKDLQGRYVFVNDSAERAFQRPRAELYGRTDEDLFPPQTAAQFRENDNRALASAAGIQTIETLQHADGIVHQSLVSKFPILGPDGQAALIGGMAIDITEHRQAEAALLQSEERFRFLADAIPSIIWTAAPDGTITYTNRRWLDYCGLTAEQNARGWPELVLHPDDYQRCVERWTEALRAGQEYEIEVRNRRHDGTYRWFITRAVPWKDISGRVISWFGVTTDIHDQKAMEEQLREADRRKDEFLAVLAHELRNPLAPIRNALHILRLGGSKASAEDVHEMLERQVNHLIRLVDDLLEVSRITRGKIELRKEPVELAAVLRSAVETSRPLIEASRHQLTLALPSEPLAPEADPVRLSQVIANLLNNAAKYTDEGGQIRLAAWQEREEVVVSVRDSGLGIPVELLPHVFDMFAQVDCTRRRAQGGLGIGLTLARRLVEMHQGRIEARSDGPGRGSEFVVRLPLTLPSRGSLQGEGGARATGLSALRILVVDDNRDAADSLALVLRLLGAEAQVVYDGPSALQTMTRLQPAVMFVDIGMPGMDGHEVARRVRQKPEWREVVLVALTGWGQEEDRRRSRAAGFDHHLTKPVDPQELQRLLARPG